MQPRRAQRWLPCARCAARTYNGTLHRFDHPAGGTRSFSSVSASMSCRPLQVLPLADSSRSGSAQARGPLPPAYAAAVSAAALWSPASEPGCWRSSALAPAPAKAAPRDRFIGWSVAQRVAASHLVVNNCGAICRSAVAAAGAGLPGCSGVASAGVLALTPCSASLQLAASACCSRPSCSRLSGYQLRARANCRKGIRCKAAATVTNPLIERNCAKGAPDFPARSLASPDSTSSPPNVYGDHAVNILPVLRYDLPFVHDQH